MLEEGTIEPSISLVVLVKKKDGSLRLCVDYTQLNRMSEMAAYPMPRIDDLIDQLGTAKYISTLDPTRGYWQVPVEKSARHKTAFSTPFGLCQFKVLVYREYQRRFNNSLTEFIMAPGELSSISQRCYNLQ